MKTEVFCEVRVTFSLTVEHGDEDLDEDLVERLVQDMTPEEWFNQYGADRPEVDVDCSDANETEEPDFFLVDGDLECASYYYEHANKEDKD